MPRPLLIAGITACILLATLETMWQLAAGTAFDDLAERLATR